MRASIRVGNGCGFWGDNLDAPIALAKHGRLDYLTLEYLAELTMSILALQKQKNPEAGFAADFIDVLTRLTPVMKEQPLLKIITNAGGMNPSACARKAREVLDAAGLNQKKIATVAGDDLMPRLDELLASGHDLQHLDEGTPLAAIRKQVVSANAYLGSQPIVEALRLGADVVITGRIADAALTVAPAMHAFGWPSEDWARLGAATAAGHLIECGAQVTGGLWCHWEEIPNLAEVGYPIAEIEPSGLFRITKPPGSGGVVNLESVGEQLLYEVGDPARYLTPDVTADFTTLQLEETAPDTVTVRGGSGKPATPTYKVSIAYRDGFTATGTLALYGQDAAAKARLAGQIILDRLRRAGHEYARHLIEVIGAGDMVPGLASDGSPREVMLRVSVHDPHQAAVERFTKEFAPLVTAGPPGVTGYTTGRASVRPVLAYWPALIAKSAVQPQVRLES